MFEWKWKSFGMTCLQVWPVVVVCCLLCVVCCVLCVVCCVLFVVCCLFVCCLLFAVCCLLFVVCCLLFVVVVVGEILHVLGVWQQKPSNLASSTVHSASPKSISYLKPIQSLKLQHPTTHPVSHKIFPYFPNSSNFTISINFIYNSSPGCIKGPLCRIILATRQHGALTAPQPPRALHVRADVAHGQTHPAQRRQVWTGPVEGAEAVETGLRGWKRMEKAQNHQHPTVPIIIAIYRNISE